MPRRLRFVVAYDGRPFAGWQSQATGNAIQDHLERAFAAICGHSVRVHGAGRTDAGVHALAQSAHADLPETTVQDEQWAPALNASLPATIRVLRTRFVSDSFHARFSAMGKLYRYRICNARFLPPLELGRAWHVAQPLDRVRIQAEAQVFRGRHDFAGFAANRGQREDDSMRTISKVTFRSRGEIIELEFSGDGFLYKMVRLMVGALVRSGRAVAAAREIRARLEEPQRFVPHARLVAPAEGLYLVRVRY